MRCIEIRSDIFTGAANVMLQTRMPAQRLRCIMHETVFGF